MTLTSSRGPLSLLALALGALRATKHITPAALAHWSTWPEVRGAAAARASLSTIIRGTAAGPIKKGQPDVNAIKRALAGEVLAVLDSDLHVRNPKTLQLAHRLAAIDMADRDAFDAYVALLEAANAAALQLARSSLTPNVVMHLSCEPRVQRAQESCKSFAAAAPLGLSQVIVVGSSAAHLFDFDVHTRVLTVPAPDSYEHLPAKVVAAMAFFALCGTQCVVKVDDDHRLSNPQLLQDYLSRVRVAHPVQMGQRNNIGILGNHVRVWHFGKCADAVRSSQPFTLPGASRWINGAAGYLLNHQAIRLLFWSHVYFPEYIRIGLYEDMTVSDLIERQGGRLVQADMHSALGVVDQY